MRLRQALAFARSRWRSMIVATLVALLIAVVVPMVQTPIYQATTGIFLTNKSNKGFGTAMDGEEYSKSRITTYAALMTSDAVTSQVVKKLGLDMTASDFGSHLITTSDIPTLVLTITAQASSARDAQRWSMTTAQVFADQLPDLDAAVDEKNTQATQALIYDPATLPAAPLSPNLTYNVLVALLLGPLIGVVVAALRLRMRNHPRSSQEAAEALGKNIPALGDLPVDPSDLLVGQVALSSDQRVRETYRMLAADLRYFRGPGRGRVIVVASATEGEGAGTIALGLATAVASHGTRTLLIDGDLRTAQVTAGVGAERTEGLRTVLRDGVDWRALLTPWRRNLDILAAGGIPPNPSGLLGQSSLPDLIDGAARDFEIVFITAPPVLAFSDAGVLGTMSDGILLVVGRGRSTRSQLAAAAGRIGVSNTAILGVIMAVPAAAGRRFTSRRGDGRAEHLSKDDTTL